MLTNISGDKLAFILNTDIKFVSEMNTEAKLQVERTLEQQVILQRQ
jgi:hypothetical protein